MWLLADEDTKIYLFGTFHLLPPGSEWRTPAFEQALSASQELVLEVPNIDDPMAVAQAMQGLASPAANPHGVQAGANQPTDNQAVANKGMANPWAELWTGWMKAAEPEKAPSHPFEDMMAAFLPPPPAPEPPKPPASPSWDEMMEQGREMQSQYLASLQSIF